ncbi:MAG: magnesium protoporphyrin IX methyltransferase [Pseudomonadota bacterium]
MTLNSDALSTSKLPGRDYADRRQELTKYFDDTAVDHWRQLTSSKKVSRIRESVRAGRSAMQRRLLSWLPQNLDGVRILDAGCGTGVLAAELANRGATVVGVDLSPQLIEVAEAHRPIAISADRLQFYSGDMLSDHFGRFDYTVAMDSLIHYNLPDAIAALGVLAARTRQAVCFTYVPRTPVLAALHAIGQWFPRDNRSPDVSPNSPKAVAEAVRSDLAPAGWSMTDQARVDTFFYKSHGVALRRRHD